MARPGSSPAKNKDLPAHQRGYDGFIRILKISTLLVAIITAVVIYIIAN
jgi:hypothetical protein